jgi:hypothetical protein
MLLFSPLGQCRVEPCDFDPNEVWTSYNHALGQKQVNLNSNIQACHGIRSSTRSSFDLNKSCPCMLDCPVHGADGHLAFLVVKRHSSPL